MLKFVLLSFTHKSFFPSAIADGLSLDIEWHQFPQVFRTLLSILAVFNNAVVRMVSTRPPTSKSSRPFNIPLVTLPKAPITIGINVTFMFHSFFNSLARLQYLSLFARSFSFILWLAGRANRKFGQILLLLLLLLLLLFRSPQYF